MKLIPLIAGALALTLSSQLSYSQDAKPGTNPLFRTLFTADPAPMVFNDTVYLYVGHDEAKGNELFTMTEWLCYSSKDMKTWESHGPIMKPTDFEWAAKDAWAAQVVPRNGKFYLYVTVSPKPPESGRAIGVAVSDSPTGPFKDARGSALVLDKMTPSPNWGDDIDPTVFIDDDGTPWLAWGNPNPYLVKLKPNMTEFDGPIQRLSLPNYTEGPWLHKRNGLYYLTYAAFAHQGFGEKICYATAKNITGPWTYRGILTGGAKNSYTIHPGIVDYKGQSYFFYHNADLTLPDGQTGATGRRAVCAEYLFYNPDGTIQPIIQTQEGLSLPPKPGAVTPLPANTLTSDAGVVVTQNSAPGATNWPGQPTLSTVSDLFNNASVPVSFNRNRGLTSIGQTFQPDKNIKLGRITLYAGDGLDTDSSKPVTLALYDLGPKDNGAAPDSYNAGTNLLGDGKGLKIAYEVQAPGLLHLDFTGENQVTLQANHTYAFELQGERNSAPLFWRRSRNDLYTTGSAFRDRTRDTERDGKSGDFAMAIYDVVADKGK